LKGARGSIHAFCIFDLVKESSKTKDPNKLTWPNYLLLAGIIVVFYFYKDSHSDIINYPEYLRYWGWVALFIGLVALRFKKFIAGYIALQTVGERLFYFVLSLSGAAIGTLMAATILLAPFNYYNAYVATQNKADTIRCTIDDAYIGRQTSDGREPNTIKYHFRGKADSLYTADKTPLIATIHQLHTNSFYTLVLATHRALLGSYWLQSWRIEEKTADTLRAEKGK